MSHWSLFYGAVYEAEFRVLFYKKDNIMKFNGFSAVKFVVKDFYQFKILRLHPQSVSVRERIFKGEIYLMLLNNFRMFFYIWSNMFSVMRFFPFPECFFKSGFFYYLNSGSSRDTGSRAVVSIVLLCEY